MHPLHAALVAAADGRFPPADGVVEVLERDAHGAVASVAMTGHGFVLTDCDPDVTRAHAGDAFGGALAPDFLRWLAGPGGWIGSQDVVLVAQGRGGGDLPRRDDLAEHPRAARAGRHRREVRIHGNGAGFVTLGRGLVDRLELSVELLSGTAHGIGEGRRLVAEGLALADTGELVWAQVAPGNAASLRAFLACGFVPVGAEVLVEPGPSPGERR